MSNQDTFPHTELDQRPGIHLLKEVKGHDFTLQTLQKAFDSNRLHHAYLFHGPSGVGKKRSALVLARLLLCSQTVSLHHPTNGIETIACGHCQSCRRIYQFILEKNGIYHPDLHIISRDRDSSGKLAKEIKIAPIRELQSALNLGSFEGGKTVIIIEDVDRLGLSAANALLKTLEEPLANVHFLLTTNSLNSVLPTIKSRAQSLRFAPLKLEILLDLLNKFQGWSQREDDTETYTPLEPQQLESLAQLSGGSLGKALRLWGQGGMDKVIRLIQQSDLSGGAQDYLKALEFVKQFEKASEEDLELWLHVLRCWYRDALVLIHGAYEIPRFFPSLSEITMQRGQTLGIERLQWRLQALDEGEKHLLKRTGSNKKLILETLCLYLAGFDAMTQQPLQIS